MNPLRRVRDTVFGGTGGGINPRGPGERYLVLVRHAEATAGWGDDPDPGLSEHGHRQAAGLVDDVAPIGPLPLVVSPLRRTRETAAPLAERWAVAPRIEPAVGEIVAPVPEADLDARADWLRSAMAGSWLDLAPEQSAWRAGVIAALRAIDVDTVVVSHFVAINAAVGEATGDDRVICFSPGHTSRTTIRVGRDGALTLMTLGGTARTTVL